MEKKYLIVKLNGKELGAFENVTEFNCDDENGVMTFRSDEGSFVYNKVTNETGTGWVSEDCDIYFDDYQLVGRRTLNRHAPEDQRQRVDITKEPETNIPVEESHNGKNRIIWDECNPTADRRPTEEEDIDNDIHVTDLEEPIDLFYELADILGADGEEELIELTDDGQNDVSESELCKELLERYNSDDPGDGSPNILYVMVNGEVILDHSYDGLESKDLSTISEDEVKDILKANLDY